MAETSFPNFNSLESLNCNISNKRCQMLFLEGIIRTCLQYSRLNNYNYSVVLSSKNDVPQKKVVSSVHNSNNDTCVLLQDNLCTLVGCTSVCCKKSFVKIYFSLVKTLQKKKDKTNNQQFIKFIGEFYPRNGRSS